MQRSTTTAAIATSLLVSALSLSQSASAAPTAGRFLPAARPFGVAARPFGLGAAHGSIRANAFTFTTLDDQADPTFNQLLGINNNGVIAGYFGSGAAGHPNKGYTLNPPYGQANYTNENYPGSAQTQVTAINNLGDTAGFWVDSNGVNRGFIEWNSVFTSYTDPKTGKGTVNQILGLNDRGTAVGFYTDGAGVNHAFKLDQATGSFRAIVVPGSSSTQATGINNRGDITGIAVSASNASSGWLLKNGQFSAFTFPGSQATTPFGINDKDQIVGSYIDGSGVMHGFLLSHPFNNAHWTSIDDPNGIGSTVVNGLNDNGDLVGFYTDAAGNTDGMLVTR